MRKKKGTFFVGKCSECFGDIHSNTRWAFFDTKPICVKCKEKIEEEIRYMHKEKVEDEK
jgi:hypothetical protein